MVRNNIFICLIAFICFLESGCKNNLSHDAKERFKKNGEIILDSDLSLMWTEKDQGFLNFDESQKYCNKLELSGHKEWRLPTLNEWRSIIVGCPMTLNAGKCKVSDICFDRNKCWSSECSCKELKGPGEHGCYWDDKVWGIECAVYWSGTKSSKYSIWSIQIDSAKLWTSGGESKNYFKCVKSIKK